jgi:septum formation protein
MSAAYDAVYLASQSPRRAQLLTQIGVQHQLLLPGDEEDAEALEAHIPGELPQAYVERVTRAKLQAALARRAARRLPILPVLCADTTVALGRRILGKPVDPEDAERSLLALSGRTHRVLTAIALGVPDQQWFALSVSHVRLAELPPAVVQAYVRSGEPFGKAGAYAIQGALSGWISGIRGSHSGIMGLPLFETAQLLNRAGVCWSLQGPPPSNG